MESQQHCRPPAMQLPLFRKLLLTFRQFTFTMEKLVQRDPLELPARQAQLDQWVKRAKRVSLDMTMGQALLA